MNLSFLWKHIPLALVLFIVTTIAGGVSAWYDLRSEVKDASKGAAVVGADLSKHEAAHDQQRQDFQRSQEALWKSMQRNHDETHEDLAEIRRMLMVPPEQRSKRFAADK